MQQQVGALHPCGAAADWIAPHPGRAGTREPTPTATTTPTAPSGVGRIGVHGHPLRGLATKGETSNLVELARLARGHVHQPQLRLDGATLTAQPLLVNGLGIDQHGGPPPVPRQLQRGASTAARSTGGGRRFTDGEAEHLATGTGLANHHVRVALVGRHDVREPRAVVGQGCPA